MSQFEPAAPDHTSNKSKPNTLPVMTRIRLPQRLRDDAWWLCPAPERPSARIVPFPQGQTLARRAERPRHD